MLNATIDDVCDVQIADDLPVFGLYAAAYVDLILDDTVRVDSQVFVAIARRSYLVCGTHERKFGEELLEASREYVHGLGGITVDLLLDPSDDFVASQLFDNIFPAFNKYK